MNVTMNFRTPETNYGISVQNTSNILIDGSNDGTDSKNLTIQVMTGRRNNNRASNNQLY